MYLRRLIVSFHSSMCLQFHSKEIVKLPNSNLHYIHHKPKMDWNDRKSSCWPRSTRPARHCGTSLQTENQKAYGFPKEGWLRETSCIFVQHWISKEGSATCSHPHLAHWIGTAHAWLTTNAQKIILSPFCNALSKAKTHTQSTGAASLRMVATLGLSKWNKMVTMWSNKSQTSG